MVLINTPAMNNKFKATNFSLKGIDDHYYSLDDVRGKNGTLIMFICNHCPYVIAIIDRLVLDCKKLLDIGVGCLAIMPNDTDGYPADSFDNMKVFADRHSFCFPYVIDETQDVARSYNAVCTPDLYGFNRNDLIQYRGRVDSAGMKDMNEKTKRELLEAMTLVAKTGLGPQEQTPSMGCSIKWRN